MAQLTCPNCGMQQSEWIGSDRHGYRAEGRLYCCQGCAGGGAGACTCRVANPGIEPAGPREGSIEALLTPRDRNGRPLAADEVGALEAQGLPVQLPDTPTLGSSAEREEPRRAPTG